MTNRIQRLKTTLFQSSREISLEHTLLYTVSHQQTEGGPVILRQARITAHIPEHVETSIHDEELAAGNRTVKPRVGTTSPEIDPYWLLRELEQLPARPQDRLDISEGDKHLYHDVLYPYWEKRSMKDFINDQMADEVKVTVSTRIFNTDQAGKDQRHVIIDYPRLLSYGFGELVAQVRAHYLQQPGNRFYRAVLLLLKTSRNRILRYAMLAEKMAESYPDAQ